MALVCARVLTDSQTGTGHTTWTTTATYTPTTNALQYAYFTFRNLTSGAAVPTLSGVGLTWVNIALHQFASFGTNYSALYRALGTGSAGALTITRQGSDTWDQLGGTVIEWTGCDTTGTNGSGAVLQTQYTDASSVTTLSVPITMGAGSGLASFFSGFGGGTTTTPRASWTERDTFNLSAQYTQEVQSLVGTDTAGSVTLGATLNIAGWVSEIKAAAASTWGQQTSDAWCRIVVPGA